MALLYFGLDGEMSGADLEDGHRLIQIGVAAHQLPDGSMSTAPARDVFSALIGWSDDALPWEPAAARVHNIPREAVLAAPPAADVDDQLHAWLTARGATDKPKRAVAVGFNVSAFDMPFVRAALPRSAALFSRRGVDLNPLCLTYAASRFAAGHGTAPGWAGWKRLAKRAAKGELSAQGIADAEHDAGYDALLHLYAWRYLAAQLPGSAIPAPGSDATL